MHQRTHSKSDCSPRQPGITLRSTPIQSFTDSFASKVMLKYFITLTERTKIIKTGVGVDLITPLRRSIAFSHRTNQWLGKKHCLIVRGMAVTSSLNHELGRVRLAQMEENKVKCKSTPLAFIGQGYFFIYFRCYGVP